MRHPRTQKREEAGAHREAPAGSWPCDQQRRTWLCSHPRTPTESYLRSGWIAPLPLRSHCLGPGDSAFLLVLWGRPAWPGSFVLYLCMFYPVPRNALLKINQYLLFNSLWRQYLPCLLSQSYSNLQPIRNLIPSLSLPSYLRPLFSGQDKLWWLWAGVVAQRVQP